MTAVGTTFFPGPNPYTGLATCVSLNSAVATRVGKQRVTWQPNISGVPDPSGMQVRVDGVLTSIPTGGLPVGPGGRVVKSETGNGIEIDFPNGAVLLATANFWGSQGKWYVNASIVRTTATDGVMGSLAPGSWLPALPDGTSVGPRPALASDRYDHLYNKFGGAWRVTDATSLFDYRPGTSTADFTIASWPSLSPPCVVPAEAPATPLSLAEAQAACEGIRDQARFGDCVFDVQATGERGFAELYRVTERLAAGATLTSVTHVIEPRRGWLWRLLRRLGIADDPVIYTATVTRKASGERGAPIGTVQFTVDGANTGATRTLDASGRATWKTTRVKSARTVGATYRPTDSATFLPSNSAPR